MSDPIEIRAKDLDVELMSDGCHGDFCAVAAQELFIVRANLELTERDKQSAIDFTQQLTDSFHAQRRNHGIQAKRAEAAEARVAEVELRVALLDEALKKAAARGCPNWQRGEDRCLDVLLPANYCFSCAASAALKPSS